MLVIQCSPVAPRRKRHYHAQGLRSGKNHALLYSPWRSSCRVSAVMVVGEGRSSALSAAPGKMNLLRGWVGAGCELAPDVGPPNDTAEGCVFVQQSVCAHVPAWPQAQASTCLFHASVESYNE